MKTNTLRMLSNVWNGSAYNAADAAHKARFHRVAAKRLREVATLLGLHVGQYDVRSNKAGVAVSGEVTLHTDLVYVQVAYFAFDRSPRILYRTCKGRRDYTGGANNYLPGYVLDSPAEMTEAIEKLLRP
jgi:hypothetical protein